MKKTTLFFSFFLIAFASNAQTVFSENWDGIGPGISGWTLYNQDGRTANTNVSFVNAAWVSTTEEFDNHVAMSTSWYTPAGASNDWLVSPSIIVPAGTTTLYWDGKAYDSTYPDSYNVYVSTSGNTPADFTTNLMPVDPEATNWTRHSIDLSAYAGQTIYIAFQNFSTDMFLLAVDNINVVNNNTCLLPDRDMQTTSISTTSSSIAWTGTSSSYDVAIGAPGFLPSTPTDTTTNMTYTFTGLTPNTRYQFYVRSSCGSSWVGPYSLFTAKVLPYDQGFETVSGGFFADGWQGGWSLGNAAANAQAGNQYAFRNSSTTVATNAWLFSRPLSLSAGEQVTMTFYTRLGSATGSAHTLKVYANNLVSTTGGTQLGATLSITGATYTLKTVTFTPTTSGVYYFAFNDATPIVTAVTSLRLDTVNITSPLGVKDFADISFSVLPNPAKDFVTISSSDNSNINLVELTDINGRVVKTAKFEGNETQLNISDLSRGVYMMKINSDKGSVTKKLVKE